MQASALKKKLVELFGTRTFGRMRFAGYVLKVNAAMLQGERYTCNICGYRGRFRPFGHPPRYGAECPQCLGVERHRLMKHWLTSGAGDLLKGKTILHFAPEPSVSDLFRAAAGRYISADINPDHADLCLNIEKIELPDQSVDICIVSHVIEHVKDAKALAELYRITRPGGTVVIMTPVVEGWDKTYENPSISSVPDRIRHFGQWDHVRMYGRDLRDRIRSAGFRLEEFTAVEPEIQIYGLQRGEKLFLAHKDAEPAFESESADAARAGA